MQASKTRSGSSDMPQKTSPITPRSTRQRKVTGPESGSATSMHSATGTPTDRSPKVTERRSPRSPASEKKRMSRVSDLEAQLMQTREDLKKTKELLSSSESSKKRALQEVDEAKKQFLAMATKLDDTKRQLLELSAAEDERIQELRKLSQERDRAWQSELEAVQKQNSVDSAALASAMNEIQKLKLQIEMVVNSEAAQAKQAEIAHCELQTLKQDMAETLSLMETLKAEHKDCEMLEVEYQGLVNDTRMQLEVAKSTIETLRLDGSKITESLKSVRAELEASRSRVNLLEEMGRKVQLGNAAESSCLTSSDPDCEDNELKAGLGSLQSEVEQLKSALEAAEVRFQEEQVKSTMQISSAYEFAERIKAESSQKEAELESTLKETVARVAELKTTLIDKEAELHRISGLNEKLQEEVEKVRAATLPELELDSKLKITMAEIMDLNAKLQDKETQVQRIAEENEMLKLEVQKMASEMPEPCESAIGEHDTEMGSQLLAGEADNTRSSKVAEQLEAAKASQCEMEAELRRLRIQSEQWRKAAEAAAAILTTGNNGKLMDRTGSMDSGYPLGGKLMSSPYSDDMDEESPKKKNNNVLRKFGVFWKKGQK